MTCRIDLIAGTRPNVVKIAPLYKALVQQDWCRPRILFIGQHTTPNMSADMFEAFGIGADELTRISLSARSFGNRLGEIIEAACAAFENDRPDIVVVPGDVDVSLGAALAARRVGVPVAHLEAGLRSYDETMPEEANRVLIDSISTLLLAPSEASAANLIYREGRSHREVHFVGNIMIDALIKVIDETAAREAMDEFGVEAGRFGILTLHRPANVDDPRVLRELLRFTRRAAERYRMIFPVHPRLRSRMENMRDSIHPHIITCEPIDYVRFVNLMSKAAFFITDSGGVQEETSHVGVPCFTLRENTERPITLYEGVNHLIDLYNGHAVMEAVLARPRLTPKQLPLWDGLTAWRVGAVLRTWWTARRG